MFLIKVTRVRLYIISLHTQTQGKGKAEATPYAANLINSNFIFRANTQLQLYGSDQVNKATLAVFKVVTDIPVLSHGRIY